MPDIFFQYTLFHSLQNVELLSPIPSLVDLYQNRINRAYFPFNTRGKNLMNVQLKAMGLSFGAVQHTLWESGLDGAFVLAHARHCQVNKSIKI